MSEQSIQLLEAYHDGELGWLGRWRARRLLARDADARAILASLETVGWLDSRGNPVVVLQDDRDATIIWLLEAPAEVSGRRGRAVS